MKIHIFCFNKFEPLPRKKVFPTSSIYLRVSLYAISHDKRKEALPLIQSAAEIGGAAKIYLNPALPNGPIKAVYGRCFSSASVISRNGLFENGNAGRR
ncbi:hypothetical protein CEXT_378331 [Caerostris extrusa]|uniref:Uncharacterized protein n=1 Tax=Caerostris extrusa TaxID=172846 RepID=A0AAV4Q395_CAEEX|nr:hypothetical protein CEXT_378331 [Caerostris extrusa]